MFSIHAKSRSSSVNGGYPRAQSDGGDEGVWQVRPGGMLVQSRTSAEANQSQAPAPTIRVRVKHGSMYHQVHISSQASFGELKKLLVGPTGLHPDDQKLIYRKRVRDSKRFLDVARVKDGSKIVLVEDIESRERRCLEMLKKVNIEKVSKTLAEIKLKVDQMGDQVSALKSMASEGGKVDKSNVEKLTDDLMRAYIKLDALIVQGDPKLQKTTQERRIQEYVESLDVLKLESSSVQTLKSTNARSSERKRLKFKDQLVSSCRTTRRADPVVMTTKWETFE